MPLVRRTAFPFLLVLALSAGCAHRPPVGDAKGDTWELELWRDDPRRAEDDRRANLSRHPDSAAAMADLGKVLTAERRYGEAEELLQRAVTAGANEPEGQVQALANLAALKLERWRLTEAEEYASRALSLAQSRLPASPGALSAAWMTVGDLRIFQDRKSEATEAYRQASALRTAWLGPLHVKTLWALDAEASVEDLVGDQAERQKRLEQAVARWRSVAGPKHPDVGPSLRALAAFHARAARFTEAEGLLKEALALEEADPRHLVIPVIKTLRELSHLLYRVPRPKEGLETAERALALSLREFPAEHYEIAEGLNLVAKMRIALHEFAEARAALHEALALFEAAVGPDEVEIAFVLNNLAYIHDDLGEEGDPEPVLLRSLAISRKRFGSEGVGCASVLTNLGQNSGIRHRYEDAVGYLSEALAIHTKLFGKQSEHTAQTMGLLAVAYEGVGRYEAARALATECVEILSRRLGPNHPLTRMFVPVVERLRDHE